MPAPSTRSPAQPDAWTEHVLSVLRVIFSAVLLGAVYVEPTVPSNHVGLAYGLMGGYVAYSLAVMFLLPRRGALSTDAVWMMHAIDIAVIALITWFTDGPARPFYVLYCFVFLTSGFRWDLPETLLNGAGAVVLTTAEAILARDAGTGDFDADPIRLVSRGALLMLLSGMVGYLARQQKRAQAAARAHAREAERVHVSRALHDGVVHALLGVKARLAAIAHAPETAASTRDTLQELDATLESEVAGLRLAMFELAQVDAGVRGIEAGLSTLAAHFQRATGITATVDCSLHSALSPALAQGLARLAQEALVNVGRHAEASLVRVRLVEGDELLLEVEDNGRGFAFTGSRSTRDGELPDGGPRLLVERAFALSGHVVVASTPSVGALVRITLPMSGRRGTLVPRLSTSDAS